MNQIYWETPWSHLHWQNKPILSKGLDPLHYLRYSDVSGENLRPSQCTVYVDSWRRINKLSSINWMLNTNHFSGGVSSHPGARFIPGCGHATHNSAFTLTCPHGSAWVMTMTRPLEKLDMSILLNHLKKGAISILVYIVADPWFWGILKTYLRFCCSCVICKVLKCMVGFIDRFLWFKQKNLSNCIVKAVWGKATVAGNHPKRNIWRWCCWALSQPQKLSWTLCIPLVSRTVKSPAKDGSGHGHCSPVGVLTDSDDWAPSGKLYWNGQPPGPISRGMCHSLIAIIDILWFLRTLIWCSPFILCEVRTHSWHKSSKPLQSWQWRQDTSLTPPVP